MRLGIRAVISLWKIVEPADFAYLIGRIYVALYPESIGPGSALCQLFLRKREAFNAMLKRLHIRLSKQGLIDVDNWMIEFRVVRATRASSEAKKKGEADEPQDHELGCSLGGLTTEIQCFAMYMVYP